jgi:voltage-gated potassium channel Kch
VPNDAKSLIYKLVRKKSTPKVRKSGLRQAGADVVMPETFESGLQIAARALELGGVEPEARSAALEACRRAYHLHISS